MTLEVFKQQNSIPLPTVQLAEKPRTGLMKIAALGDIGSSSAFSSAVQGDLVHSYPCATITTIHPRMGGVDPPCHLPHLKLSPLDNNLLAPSPDPGNHLVAMVAMNLHQKANMETSSPSDSLWGPRQPPLRVSVSRYWNGKPTGFQLAFLLAKGEHF